MYRPRCQSNDRNQSLRQATLLNRNHSLVHSQLQKKNSKAPNPDQNPPHDTSKNLRTMAGRRAEHIHQTEGPRTRQIHPTQTSFDQASSIVIRNQTKIAKLQQKGMSFTRWAMAEEQGYALRAKRPGGPSIGGSPPATLSVFRACLFPYCVRVFFAGGREGRRGVGVGACQSFVCLLRSRHRALVVVAGPGEGRGRGLKRQRHRSSARD